MINLTCVSSSIRWVFGVAVARSQNTLATNHTWDPFILQCLVRTVAFLPIVAYFFRIIRISPEEPCMCLWICPVVYILERVLPNSTDKLIRVIEGSIGTTNHYTTRVRKLRLVGV
ncbi:hypothetical protein TNCV_2070921 [Trichonephila clavipes]|uniref:Uncharacterized protein n=1 Tax=Trichonephila clavipes TaxID=2585209 RepID=A0A8X6W378_TRICX|nr:hypothetical protein TNCV_2070921 [Trichonephila clavipes]